MGSFENTRCLCLFVTVCDNPSKCVLNTLQFADVETGQTPEERAAVMKVTTHQGINCQDGNLISQILSSPPDIMHLNETSLINMADMISKGEISINSDPRLFLTTAGIIILPNI